jgi:hypothetical protein
VIRGLRVPVHLTSRDALRIFDLADIWATRTGNSVRLVSANDHVHSRASAHYAGLALDLHSSNPAALAAALRRAGYRVLWNVPGHYGHVHVERPEPAGAARPLWTARRAVADRHAAATALRTGRQGG